jgi:hypothetical protein
MRAGLLLLMVAVGSVAMSGGAAGASPRPQIRADLEGKSIPIAKISSYFCHDFDFPRIHCFDNPTRLEASIGGDGRSTTAALAFGPNDFVTIYSGPTYSGGYVHLSQNYDTLFVIGWNDQVSSYKGRNSASGTFWSDWYGSGRGTNFCCNTNVPYLPSGVDNTFTSVYRH